MTTSSGYDLHTELVIGGCLRGSRQDTENVLFGSGLLKTDLPSRNMYPEIYEGVLSILRNPNEVPTAESVWVAMGRKVDLSVLTTIRDKASAHSPAALRTSASTVIRLAERSETHKHVTQALSDLLKEDIPTRDIKTSLQVALAKSRSPEIQPADAHSVGERWRSKIGNPDSEPIESSRMPWLNFVTNGGLRIRRLYGIAGADNSPALERSVHNYWEVTYDEESPQSLKAKQIRARRSAGGNKSMYIDFWIQPSTGCILDEVEKKDKLLTGW